jgi:hypothetical protein
VNERDFLRLAFQLASDASEADWRTAVGRAYYTAFHVARRLLEDLGFVVPRMDRAHAYLSFRLQNCGDAPLMRAGIDLYDFRQLRNVADYDLHRPVPQPLADRYARLAGQVIAALDAARAEPTRSTILNGMRTYERTVLGVVTWQGP